MSGPIPQDARHDLLEPYVGRLRAFLRARGDEDRPLAIPCEPRPLELSEEERKAAWSVLCDESVAWSDAGAWIPLGAALYLAVATALEGAAGADTRAAAERLGGMRAVAAGYSEALREALADMVTGGRTEEAKRLSSFRNKLLGILTALRVAAAVDARPATRAQPDEPPSDAPPEGSGDAAVSPGAPVVPDPALAAYLRRAAAFLRARGHQERPLTVTFGRRSLSLSAWERRVLWQALCEGQAPGVAWHRLIPESAAVQLALLPLLDELDHAGGGGPTDRAARAAVAEVVQHAAAVVEGFRTETQRAVAAAALDDAKQLSTLSGAFAATLIAAKRALAEAPAGGVPAAEGAGPDATAAPEPSAAGTSVAPPGPPDALTPFLERAAHLLEVQGRDDRPVSISVGERSWNLDGWERQVLWKVWCEEGPPPPEWSVVLGHGAAAQLAALLALERLRRAGGAPAARAAAEAERDAALELGADLVERLRVTAEAVAADGQVKLAERLMRFGAKLSEPVKLLKQTRS